MDKRVFLIPFLFLLVGGIFAFAQTTEEDPVARRTRLEAELKVLEDDIAKNRGVVEEKQKQAASLERDISILNAKIKESQSRIKKHDLTIKKISGDIVVKEIKVRTLDSKIDKEKEALAEMMRRLNELGSRSLAEFVLQTEKLSSFFSDIDDYKTLQREINDLVTELRSDIEETNKEKENLEDKKEEQVSLKTLQEIEKRKVESNKKEKSNILTETRGQEKEYRKVLEEKERVAAKIRAELFSLRDVQAIPFGKAYEYALYASQKTGVRPAFILAILTQESNLGQNTGSCYLANTQTGEGISSKTRNIVARVMKPDRDVPPFLELMQELGRDPYRTLVSCPQSFGWGGAMGPSQFIPSTWKLQKQSISQALGKSVPDPWEPRDAIMAMAMYLADLGAGSQNQYAERNAACRYYSGKSCSSSRVISTYGSQVVLKAQDIQQNKINFL